MRQKIIYTLKDKETILNEDQLHEHTSYLKHFYCDVVLQKVEEYAFGKLLSAELYISEDNITDEEILFENVFVTAVTIIREKLFQKYTLLHKTRYYLFTRQYENYEIKDSLDRIISILNVYQKGEQPDHNKKTMHGDNGDKLDIYYFSSGNPTFKKSEIEKKLSEFSKNCNEKNDDSYYLNFFPMIPSGEIIETETCKYFSEKFGVEKEVTLQEAFFKRSFEKRIYRNNIHQRTIRFSGFKVYSKDYFVYDNFPMTLKLEDININVTINYLREKRDGFTKWEIEEYKKNIFTGKRIEVFDILDKSIFRQIFDLKGNVEFTRKDAYYDGDDNEYDGFYYDENGVLTTEYITIDDGWSGEDVYISDLRNRGFFNSDYGKYYLSAKPEIPESRFLIKSYREIYRNHLGEIITKEEAEELYEYIEEIFENDLPKNKTTYKAFSKKDLKEKTYKQYTESYHHHVKEIPNLEDFYLGRNTIYYNRRLENTYIVYDFLVRDVEDFSQVKYSGTVVYDNFYRLISKITFKERTKELISGQKIHYNFFEPHHTTDKGSAESIFVNFNHKGEIENYVDRSKPYSPDFYSKEKYENEYFFSMSAVNQPYYKSLKSLVPEEKAYPFKEFEQETMYFRKEGSHWDTGIDLFMSDSKLKIALDDNCYYYFLGENEKPSDLPIIDSNFNIVFSNIKKSAYKIETDCNYDNKFKMHFIISLDSGTIECQFENNFDNKLSFALLQSADYSDLYSFYYDDKRMAMMDIYLELIIQLLLKA
ncbi:hypothetical protein [Chryseobacterium sp. GP-SGM7]|uniref:hypothetical protein n=1 Tax=Chryseobacterium sp. GP-SGM7 TaxID=3411323 RepID=UPI003B962549